MNYESKILYGLDKIHYCKNGVIKPLTGALDIEISLDQPYQYLNIGSSKIRFNGNLSGKGKLTVLNLTLEEQADLLGYSYSYGELSVSDSVNAPNVALLFSRMKVDGYELYTVVYNCIFENTDISSTSTKGEFINNTLTLNFDVFVDPNEKLTYFVFDTKIGDKNKKDRFFEALQIPGKEVR